MSATDQDTPRRLTPTERLHEVTMASVSRAAAPPESSVTITRNARGVIQWEVTVRAHDYATCLIRAREVEEQLTKHYPYPDANGSES